MPNWCTNELRVTGDVEEMKSFYSFFPRENNDPEGKIVFTFNVHYLMPVELNNTRSPMLIISSKEYDEQERKFAENKNEKYDSRCLTQELSNEYKIKFGYDNWYDWSIANWGCKWDASSIDVYDESENNFEIRFDTPWSPPEGWFKKVCKDFPKLYFRMKYEEEGMGFFGRMKSIDEGDYVDNCIED